MKRTLLKPKELKNLGTALVALALMTSCGEKKTQTPAREEAAPVLESVATDTSGTVGIGFDQEEFNAFFTQYLALQKALVASDPTKAEAVARKMEQITLDSMPEVSEAMAALAKSDHLGQQRALFYELNKAMAPYLKAHQNSGEIYQQFCPMAFENTGAFWFSDSEEILNPYFGDAMLRCGTVEKTYGAL
jgi:hypothetical protein